MKEKAAQDFLNLVREETAKLLKQPLESITEKTEFPKDISFLQSLSMALMEYDVFPDFILRMKTVGKLAAALAQNYKSSANS